MKRLVVLLVAGWVAGCATPVAGPGAAVPVVSLGSATGRPALSTGGPVCAIGPDGGPQVADTAVAERGIGGTGGPATRAGSTQLAERGIGGTGIVGIITGFASVCVNGLEVGYDNTATVELNGVAAPVSALRVGQIVLIEADGPSSAPHARRISVRQEVAGRIEAMELGSGTLTIAGLPVSVPAGTWGAERFTLGDWVAVSGLRRPDGVIVASRLEAAPRDAFMARGRVVHEGVAHVGRLVLPDTMANSVRDGQSVIVRGARGQVTSVTPDPLSVTSASYFGPAVDHLSLQAFVRVANGSVWVDGLKLRAGPALAPLAGPDGIAVVSLERAPDGSFAATALRYTDVRVHVNRGPGASVTRGQRDTAIIPPAGVAKALGTGATGSWDHAPSPADAEDSDADAPAASTPLAILTPATSSRTGIDHTLPAAPPHSPSVPTTGLSIPILLPPVSTPDPMVAAPAPIASPVVTPPAATLPASTAPASAGTAPLTVSPTSDLISTNDKSAPAPLVLPVHPIVGPESTPVTIVQLPPAPPLPSRNVVVHAKHPTGNNQHEPPRASAPPTSKAPAPPTLLAGSGNSLINTTPLLTRTTIVAPQSSAANIVQRAPTLSPPSRTLVVHAKTTLH